METFDSTRPIVAAMAVGVGRAALEELRTILEDAGVEISYDKPAHAQSAPGRRSSLRLEADWEAGYLQPCARRQAGQRHPQLQEASMGRPRPPGWPVTSPSRRSNWQEPQAYSEADLLEKWARDSRSWTSSRAPNRSSNWWWPGGCWRSSTELK